MLHRRRRLLLKAVVANGGKQALARARLAQCLLNHVGVTDVPVGIGSEGSQVYTPQPHEYRLPGYDAVRDEQLYHGHSLLVRALESSAARSVYVVCISSLRDLADVMEARPDLAFSRVRAVSVQGGLAPDPSAPFGWVPDTSVNNTVRRDDGCRCGIAPRPGALACACARAAMQPVHLCTRAAPRRAPVWACARRLAETCFPTQEWSRPFLLCTGPAPAAPRCAAAPR